MTHPCWFLVVLALAVYAHGLAVLILGVALKLHRMGWI